MKFQKVWLLCLLIALPCCSSTCAGTAESFALRRVRGWEFRADPVVTLAELSELLEREGFLPLVGAPPFARPLRVPSRDADRVAFVRFLGVPSGYSVDVTFQSETRLAEDGDGGPPRYAVRSDPADITLIWQLVQRTEPQRASAIRHDSERDAEHSRAAWRACDDFWQRSLDNAAREANKRTQQASSPSRSP